MSILTLSETAESLHQALRDYIEATYHISDQGLVRQRRRLLEQPGVIRQHAYIESTPRYLPGSPFEDLGLPQPALELLGEVAKVEFEGSRLVHDPPYEHQAKSLQGLLVEGRSLMVTTGTGSGKTECFTLPILGRLANEAATSPESFSVPAVRAVLLYPMNALVNDQLGRLRLLFGNRAVSQKFLDWAGRPARFARYTSRTLYPGVRTAARDQRRLLPLGKYYVNSARAAAGEGSNEEVSRAQRLLSELTRRGKWPAKPDIVRWYGASGSRWRDQQGNFIRAVTLPDDPELLTRHEVLAAAPDVLVTNYSMLEYMLMRPLERPLFDATREWLAAFPTEKFVLVVDEAHLYRGAAGTEVALLLRRLRDRLGLSPERLQVICTSASFADVNMATQFGARLTGKHPDDFLPIQGELALRPEASAGSSEDAESLASIDLESFYRAESPAEKLGTTEGFVKQRGVAGDDPRTVLYDALREYPPMSLLTNETMKRACRVDELGPQLFPEAGSEASQRATAALVALGSYSREKGKLDGPGLLPSRVHAFFRGLPGLWVCVDPECGQLPSGERGGPVGSLFGQPRSVCLCGARVFELFTCRQCGTAYCRGYTDSIVDPHFLWPEPGKRVSTPTVELAELEPIDILLDDPAPGAAVRPADLDIATGRLDAPTLGARVRQVFLPGTGREGDADAPPDGTFRPCGVCGKQRSFGRSWVQDHQTKGDEPFQALVTRQVEVQQPTAEPTPFAPLAGKKVLVFSDSRQTAARLAPNLQKYTTRDAVRPLLVYGFELLASQPTLKRRLSLEDAYLAILLASSRMKVRLRPPTKTAETFDADLNDANRFLGSGGWEDPEEQLDLVIDFRARNAPEYLLSAITDVINHQYYGLSSLALASLAEVENKSGVVSDLPDLEGFESPDQKRALLRLWLDSWRAQWLKAMPSAWANTEIHPEGGAFPTRFRRILGSAVHKVFAKDWMPLLLETFAQPVNSKFFLKGGTVTLSSGGSWLYCQSCRSTQRPFPSASCAHCGREAIHPIDPDADEVFVARKGYYRRDTIEALRRDQAPLALIAAEHTAQLNDAQADDVFSDAEEHELLFQDVDLGTKQPAIDVLSCTTTMEVGIDIGALSGVALRNMPPGRANYQQRAGRAGRRSRAVATVLAFASADSHDEYSFGAPEEVIRGEVVDPELGLNNWQIARRHLTAFLLQRYLQDRLPPVPPFESEAGAQPSTYGSQLFEVLGTVEAFKNPGSVLNRQDFSEWLASNSSSLLERALGWLPSEAVSGMDTAALGTLIQETGLEIDGAIDASDESMDGERSETLNEPDEGSDGDQLEVPTEQGEEQPTADAVGENLLDRLLYRNVLPRYAFPTDVAAFHVFAPDSTPYRPMFQYTPSQGLPVALSQYAPGKTVWIGSKEWQSGAIYSPMSSERFEAWQARRWYLECRVCGYATTVGLSEAERREQRDCLACGSAGELGPAQTWFRPPGFAHPYSWDEGMSPDDSPEPSYATRAKLTAPTPADPERWTVVSERIRSYFDQWNLLVTNAGARADGYSYCTKCGLIEPAAVRRTALGPGHLKPFPDNRHPVCNGGRTATNLVLGTDFISDVLLISLKVDDPLTLRPELTSTWVSLRTLSEALTATAARMLGIDPGELHAEYRPALTPGGRSGSEAEIYIYDTLPGGAGFSQRAGELGPRLFAETLALLEECPAECESSCYRCLRSYRNKLDHGELDRHVGASLLRYLLLGAQPSIDPARASASMELLFEDLDRMGLEGMSLSRETEVEVAGIGRLSAPILVTLHDGRRVVLALRIPFTTDVLATPEWMEPAEFSIDPQVVPVDELAVRSSLPRASHQIIRRLGLE